MSALGTSVALFFAIVDRSSSVLLARSSTAVSESDVLPFVTGGRTVASVAGCDDAFALEFVVGLDGEVDSTSSRPRLAGSFAIVSVFGLSAELSSASSSSRFFVRAPFKRGGRNERTRDSSINAFDLVDFGGGGGGGGVDVGTFFFRAKEEEEDDDDDDESVVSSANSFDTCWLKHGTPSDSTI